MANGDSDDHDRFYELILECLEAEAESLFPPVLVPD